MTKANYHTHTSRCHHADGSDEDYVRSAIRGGYDILGFSDHTPWPYASGFISRTRMLPSELEGYVQSLQSLRAKYKGQLEIKIGLECEYYPAMRSWLSELKEAFGLDYLIFGNHHYPSDEESAYFGMHTTDEHMLHRYEQSVLEGLETGYYTYLAHPDLFMGAYPQFDKHCEEVARNICREAKKRQMPLEYNLGCVAYSEQTGHTLFPHPDFWQIVKEEDCEAIIGIDAHLPFMLETSRYYDQAIKTLEKLGIKRLEALPL